MTPEWDSAYGEAWLAVELAQDAVERLTGAARDEEVGAASMGASKVLDSSMLLLRYAKLLATTDPDPYPRRRTRKTEAP